MHWVCVVKARCSSLHAAGPKLLPALAAGSLSVQRGQELLLQLFPAGRVLQRCLFYLEAPALTSPARVGQPAMRRLQDGLAACAALLSTTALKLLDLVGEELEGEVLCGPAGDAWEPWSSSLGRTSLRFSACIATAADLGTDPSAVGVWASGSSARLTNPQQLVGQHAVDLLRAAAAGMRLFMAAQAASRRHKALFAYQPSSSGCPWRHPITLGPPGLFLRLLWQTCSKHPYQDVGGLLLEVADAASFALSEASSCSLFWSDADTQCALPCPVLADDMYLAACRRLLLTLPVFGCLQVGLAPVSDVWTQMRLPDTAAVHPVATDIVNVLLMYSSLAAEEQGLALGRMQGSRHSGIAAAAVAAAAAAQAAGPARQWLHPQAWRCVVPLLADADGMSCTVPVFDEHLPFAAEWVPAAYLLLLPLMDRGQPPAATQLPGIVTAHPDASSSASTAGSSGDNSGNSSRLTSSVAAPYWQQNTRIRRYLAGDAETLAYQVGRLTTGGVEMLAAVRKCLKKDGTAAAW